MSADKIEKRAEGWWWGRRLDHDSPWQVVRVSYRGERLHVDGWDVEGEVEWGPYLGQEPQDFLAAIVAYASDHGTDRVGGLSFEEIVRELATAGADTLRIVVDEGRRPAKETPEPVDHYPERNSDENRKLYGAPDGWDLVWWECIKPGDVVRYREGPHFSGDRERVHEGTVELVDALGPTIRIAGITGFNPTVNPMAWLRKRSVEETPTP